MMAPDRDRDARLREAIIAIGSASPHELVQAVRGLSIEMRSAVDTSGVALRPVASRLRAQAVRESVARDMDTMLRQRTVAERVARPAIVRSPKALRGGPVPGRAVVSRPPPVLEGGILRRMCAHEPLLLSASLNVDEFAPLSAAAKWLAKLIEQWAEVRLAAAIAQEPWAIAVRRWRKGSAIHTLRWIEALRKVECKPLLVAVPTSCPLIDDDDPEERAERLRWIAQQGAELSAGFRAASVAEEVDADEAGALVLYTASSSLVAELNSALRDVGEHRDPSHLGRFLPLVKLMLMATFKLRPLHAPGGPAVLSREVAAGSPPLGAPASSYWAPRNTLWRSVLGTDLRESGYRVGAVVRWWGFSSASISRWAAEELSCPMMAGDAVVHDAYGLPRRSSVAAPHGQCHSFCQIDDVSSAVEIARYSKCSQPFARGETSDFAEVLILPGARLEVLDVCEQPYGVFVHLRECLM